MKKMSIFSKSLYHVDDPNKVVFHRVNPHPAYPQIMVGVNSRMRDAVFLFSFL
jgi:hypothetical protein